MKRKESINSATEANVGGGVKMLLDLAPLAAFFIGYRFFDLMIATALIIVVTLICLAFLYWKERKLAISPLVTGVMVTFFGGLTLILDDEDFIKIKPTIVNLCFAAVLLIGVYVRRKGLLKYLFDAAFQLNEEGWLKLSRNWGFYFVFLAALNEFIWRTFPTDFWVNFKVFGMLTCTLLFTISQISLLKKYATSRPQA